MKLGHVNQILSVTARIGNVANAPLKMGMRSGPKSKQETVEIPKLANVEIIARKLETSVAPKIYGI